MAGRSAAEVLLELLELVPDAATLELLLEPENLLAILRAKGWTDDDVRADLAARSPGELLLDVLRNDGDVQALLRLPGVRHRAAPAAAAAPARGVTAMDVLSPRTTLERVGGVLVLVAATGPAIFVGGILPEAPRLELRVAAAVAAAGGAFGGALYGRARSATAAGIASGALAAAGSVVATWLYVGLRGAPALRLELILVVFLGLVPGALLYAIAARDHTRVR